MAINRADVRMPEGMYEALTAWAADDHRSLNSQIVWILERAITTRTEYHGYFPGVDGPPVRAAR